MLFLMRNQQHQSTENEDKLPCYVLIIAILCIDIPI